MKAVSPCGRVLRASVWMKTSGKKKSFQIGTALWMAAITMAGRVSGSMIDHMMRASRRAVDARRVLQFLGQGAQETASG